MWFEPLPRGQLRISADYNSIIPDYEDNDTAGEVRIASSDCCLNLRICRCQQSPLDVSGAVGGWWFGSSHAFFAQLRCSVQQSSELLAGYAAIWTCYGDGHEAIVIEIKFSGEDIVDRLNNVENTAEVVAVRVADYH